MTRGFNLSERRVQEGEEDKGKGNHIGYKNQLFTFPTEARMDHAHRNWVPEVRQWVYAQIHHHPALPPPPPPELAISSAALHLHPTLVLRKKPFAAPSTDVPRIILGPELCRGLLEAGGFRYPVLLQSIAGTGLECAPQITNIDHIVDVLGILPPSFSGTRPTILTLHGHHHHL